MHPFTEKRKYPRLKTCIQVECSYVPGPQWDSVRQEQVTAKDLSPMGLCFCYTKEIPPGTVLKLKFTEPESKEYIDGFGRVSWCAEDEKNRCWRAGVEFIAANQNRVEKDYCTQAEKWLKTYCEA